MLAFSLEKRLTAPTLEDRQATARERILVALRDEYGRAGRPVPMPRLARLAHASRETLDEYLQSMIAEGLVF